ncbi:MAG: DNA polymerase domain-containing protein [Marinagarivorans sp.]|nr:DNA polymerase domain-containing protein [Marinagarivorans sp.]
MIMNSFYGVLGSTGCRFFDPRVCSSITLRGHQILQQTQHWIEAQGHQVIYGDTDSVFVWVGNERSEQQALDIGKKLAVILNHNWQQKLQADYGIVSALEIEFETHYLKFLMPTIRNSTQGSKKRYAGLINKKGEQKIIFKGLENVRTDWTELAKHFQKTLYTMVFNGDAVEAYIQKTTLEVLNGQRDHELIYAKRLRQHLELYQKNVPPHVQAARKLPPQQQPKRGETVSYLLTVNGPEPITDDNPKPASAIAYDEYIERQLKPVADSVLQFIGLNFDEITSSQLNLF